MADQLADTTTLNMVAGIRNNDSPGTDPPRTGNFVLHGRREEPLETSTAGWRNP